MRRLILLLSITTLILITGSSLIVAQSEESIPVINGMKFSFNYIIAHKELKERTWEVTVVKNSYPDVLTYSWLRPQKGQENWTGTRILTDLKTSRNFNPFFKKGESKTTTDTAPWISIQILKELLAKGSADNFREGGSGAVNWAATSLEVKEKVIFPVTINGKAQALHGLRLNKGLIVWNNLQNPLILEYKPLAVPIFTSITGWRLTTIDY